MEKSSLDTPTWISLLRHGTPEGGSRYRGWQDDPLSAQGWQEMAASVSRHDPWPLIITSPLCRCADFAHSMGKEWQAEVIVETRFKEYFFGEWEGKTGEELYAEDRQRLVRFWADPLNNPPPGGEHLEHLNHRVTAAWNDIIKCHKGERLLCVVHSGIMKALVAHITLTPLTHLSRLVFDHAALVSIRVDEVSGQEIPKLLF
ncbi:MAG: histidine phosphatase family protein [Magnetococcales bacterium]|nr:histidine phosphatase family protein [Magnetococcales bacterium]